MIHSELCSACGGPLQLGVGLVFISNKYSCTSHKKKPLRKLMSRLVIIECAPCGLYFLAVVFCANYIKKFSKTKWDHKGLEIIISRDI